MLPKSSVEGTTRHPRSVDGSRSANFVDELSAWFELLIAPTQRTGAVVAGAPPPSGRIPFLIF